MARRKRGSLKDKGPETLGLTSKKGKGIDMLFGGPLEKRASASSSSSPSGSEKINDSSPAESEETATAPPASSNDEAKEVVEETVVAPPPAPVIATGVSETLPVNEADSDDSGVITSSKEVDDLGLPVAMEAPPADLEFAALPTEPVTGTGEKDAFDPSLSPFAAPAPAPSISEPAPPDLETLPADEVDDDLSGILQEDDDLSGLVSEVETAPPAPTVPPADLPPVSPPPTTMPVSVSPAPAPVDTSPIPTSPVTTTPPAPVDSSVQPPPPPPTVSPTGTIPASAPPAAGPYTPPASSVGTPYPGGTAIPTASSFSMPRSEIESLGGIVAESMAVSAEDLLPSDVIGIEASHIIGVAERAQVEKDAAIAAEVTRYIGRERRENLDKEIERLYDEVATRLNVNTKDAEFALKTLSEAQDIVFEDVRQYDEALYRVAVVKTMLARKRTLERWSYTWGLFVFFYAVVWLIAFVTGFMITDILKGLEIFQSSSEGVIAVRAAWFSALAGGVGGIIDIFYSLYWHVAIKQDFDRQYVMYYLVKPIMGFVLGALVYFIVLAGFLAIRFTNALSNPMVIAIQIVVGCIAGFRQRIVFEMIDKIVQRLSPRKKEEVEEAKPVSLAPADQLEKTSPSEAS